MPRKELDLLLFTYHHWFVKRYFSFFKDNPVTTRILLFSLTLFFLKIADGMFSFWVPIQIKDSLNSSVLMGLIISFQSAMGLLMDLIFPRLLGTFKTRSLSFWSIIITGVASILLFGTNFWPFIILFLITMVAWSIYFELSSFAAYQFVGTSVPENSRSSAWGIINVFWNLALFLGPMVASFVLIKSAIFLEVLIILTLCIALGIFFLTGGIHDVQTDLEFTNINPFTEIKHWVSLFKVVWPAVVISLLLGFIDATYWTVGATWSERIVENNYLGGFIISAYELPFLFMGLFLVKWGINHGKKLLSEKLLVVVGLLMALMLINNSFIWQLGMILLSSCLIALVYPLIEGVYSDLIARMGHSQKDMIGLTSSTVNISYMIWPVIAGLISTKVGESATFGILGIVVCLVALILIFITPKKLRLPQGEIKTWEQN